MQFERDRAAALQKVNTELATQRAAIEKASTKLAKTDAIDKAEIKRLKKIAAKLDHKPASRLCPPTVFEVLHGAGYTPIPGHE